MKAIKLFFLSGLLVTVGLVSWIMISDSSKNTAKNSIVEPKGFAVIELFTSEGCSSCPPADQLVEKIQKEDDNLPVYILAYHVDYWNRLGWKDVFSSAAYSKRQNQYAQWLNLQSVYTPQIVVNGRKQFIGSQEGTLRNEIKSSLENASSVKLSLEDVKLDQDEINLQYFAEGTIGSKTDLVLALIQKSATINVKAGENGGRTLSHVQIVRNLQSINLNGKNSGKLDLKVSDELKGQSLEIIAFLQNQNNGQILAAAKTEIGSPASAEKAK